MTKPTIVSGSLQLTVHGRSTVAVSMYEKGKSFIAAALLLRQAGGYEYVVLHLLCQGIEIVLKGILLSIDYPRFSPKLKGMGHKLPTIWDALIKAASLPALAPEVRAELESLNHLYSNHHLRYGSGYDILVNPTTIGEQCHVVDVHCPCSW